MAHSLCMPDNQCYRRKLRICNTYSVSTVTMVTRTRPNVTFPVLSYQYIQSAKIFREQTQKPSHAFLSLTAFTLLFQCTASIHTDNARSSDMTDFSPNPWLYKVHLTCFNKLRQWVSHTKPSTIGHINVHPQTVFKVLPQKALTSVLLHFHLRGHLTFRHLKSTIVDVTHR